MVVVFSFLCVVPNTAAYTAEGPALPPFPAINFAAVVLFKAHTKRTEEYGVKFNPHIYLSPTFKVYPTKQKTH